MPPSYRTSNIQLSWKSGGYSVKYAMMMAKIIPPRISPLPVVFPTLTPTNSIIASMRMAMKDEAVPMKIRKPQIS